MRISGAVWDDLLIREAAMLELSNTIVTNPVGEQASTGGDRTTVRRVVDGAAAEINREYPEAVTAAEKLVASGGIVVIASAVTAGSWPGPEPTVHPIRAGAQGWTTLTTAILEYLARDA